MKVLELNKENYEVPRGEEIHYHVKIEQVVFDVNSGERKSVPRVQKFGQKEWNNVYQSLLRQGYTVEILHDPKTPRAEETEKITNIERYNKSKKTVKI